MDRYWSTATQEQIEAEARLNAGQGYEDTGSMDDYVWTLESPFPLYTIYNFGMEGWEEWKKEEWAAWAEEGQPDRYDYLNAWPTGPNDDPVVVAQATDGTWKLWDGHHRTAIAVCAGRTYGPAIVGRWKQTPS